MTSVTRSFAAIAMSLMLTSSFASAQNSSLLHATPPWMPNAPARSPGPVVPVNNLQQRSVPGVGPDAAVMPPEFLPPGMAERVPTGQYPDDANEPNSMEAAPTYDNSPPPAVGLAGVSWTYQPAPPMRAFRVQDIVTIRVDEIARMMAEGDTEKRRVSLFQATLSEWIKLGSGGLIPDPQEDGDPTVDAQTTANSRAEASVESRESMSFNIAARIVDIRPNGNLVVEARKQYRVNDNLWETSLSGICRAQDIGPDNVVLSRDLIDLEINKQDQGQLRDGYRRGWFQRAFDRLKPF
ncbi:flagellar basal body L-ring protein FlgH [Rhodopirellula bahusiensis]|uniref:Flagellar biosynthesis protein FlgH n=1 Tax=Rhodopirellula bahusiensis TaxID=2014065 RepID=A0A2G1W2F1_9BACT|nr:flagellar basal body L-ring protein FlgH [Rhodopirellula bahusiensis]PHQ33204.1 flagellar biosynthesis protein FlgH [Rhodopirellula bahusiensis]